MTDDGFEVVSKYGDDRFPEHRKLREVSDRSQAIGEFVEWVAWKYDGACFATIPDGYRETWFPLGIPITRLLAEFFEIDQDKIEDEKRAMLDQIRSDNS